MGDEFTDIINSLCEGPESEGLGAVVLTGQGRAFSAGGAYRCGGAGQMACHACCVVVVCIMVCINDGDKAGAQS